MGQDIPIASGFDQFSAIDPFTQQQIAARGGGMGSGLFNFVSVPLTANEINHLFSSPKTIMAAPGSGLAIIPFFVEWYNHVGTVPTGGPNADAGNIILTYTNANGPIVTGDFGTFESAVSAFLVYPLASLTVMSAPTTSAQSLKGNPASWPLTLVDNQPLVISNSEDDYVDYGAILTSSITAGNAGTGYAINDTGSIAGTYSPTGGGSYSSSGSQYLIDTVDGITGAVLTYHLTTRGHGYKTGITGNPAAAGGAQPGIGTGLQIDVNSVTPGNGSGLIVLTYKIVTL